MLRVQGMLSQIWLRLRCSVASGIGCGCTCRSRSHRSCGGPCYCGYGSAAVVFAVIVVLATVSWTGRPLRDLSLPSMRSILRGLTSPPGSFSAWSAPWTRAQAGFRGDLNTQTASRTRRTRSFSSLSSSSLRICASPATSKSGRGSTCALRCRISSLGKWISKAPSGTGSVPGARSASAMLCCELRAFFGQRLWGGAANGGTDVRARGHRKCVEVAGNLCQCPSS